VADKRQVVYTGIGQSGDANIEHQKAGLMWNMDNWLYTTYNAFRIRWTPGGILREPTGSNGGQWGLSHDDDGKPWFVDAGGERGPMNFQYPIHYGAFTPCAPAGGLRGRGGLGAAGAPAAGAAPDAAAPVFAAPAAPSDPDCPTAFEKDFEMVWPAPGIGDMQGGLGRTRMPAQNLNHFTASTGPDIVRGHRLPADLKGDLLFTEPVGRLIRRAKIVKIEGLTQLRNAYPGSEFLISQDQLFRPVNIRTAPDGTVYVADMYHGIIQELQWSGPGSYLRAKIEQYQLDKVASYGRIWRLRYDGRPAVPTTATNPGQAAIPAIEPDFAPPHMYSETSAQLVGHFTHPNGWWRDMAQRLLVLKQDKSVVPALRELARGSDNLVARFHSLWTLEGLGALDASLVREAMKDSDPRMRVQAIRASETLYKAGDKSFDADYRAFTKDSDTDVVIQAVLTLNLFKAPDLAAVVRSVEASNRARGVKEIGDRVLAPPAAAGGFGGGRGGPALSPEQQNLLQQGGQVFTQLCGTCHGDDARGRPLAGASPGTTMAPPLAGSPRVNGHRDYVIKALLGGLTGPIGDKTYTEVMVPMGANKDEWIAGVASYVRTNFGNNGGVVTPADVARVRAAMGARKAPWTVPELEATLPRALETQESWKLTASHNADTASNALTLRAWSTGVPQAADMWFQVELPKPALLTEVQFDSPAGRGGGGGRGAAGAGRGGRGAAAPAAVPAGGGFGPGAAGPPPVPAFPHGYRVQISMDGAKWSEPVAEGKGSGTRTAISFKPVQAKFLRITQTDTIENASNWTISGLRIYEAFK
jgi:mono/diheme cytochrome c family protein